MKLLLDTDDGFLKFKSSWYLFKGFYLLSEFPLNEPCRGKKCSTEAAVPISELAIKKCSMILTFLKILRKTFVTEFDFGNVAVWNSCAYHLN